MVTLNEPPYRPKRATAPPCGSARWTRLFRAEGAGGARSSRWPVFSFPSAGGELVSILGPSGCGKSTLLRLIAGLDVPNSGTLWVGVERPTRGPQRRARPGVSGPESLLPWLSVRRNIQAGLVARGLLREKGHEVDEFMRLVGLEAFANAYPTIFPVAMAHAPPSLAPLINHPKVLLLDEPLGAPRRLPTRMRMQDEVLRLWQARRITMLSSSPTTSTRPSI